MPTGLAPTLPTEKTPSTSPTKRMLAEANNQDVYHSRSGSPPRTPPRRRKDPPSSYPKSARLAAATGIPFLDDLYGHERDSTTDDDNEDPHDLTYSSKHFPRASMVDNMLMALDQFSHPNAESRTYDEDLRADRRGRGHTFSSSLSSEGDIRALQPKSIQTPPPRLTRRSSARYARDPSRLPSIFGEDEDNTRVRIYEAQRAAPTVKNKKERTADHKGSGSMSTLEISHVQFLQGLQGRLGPAGNRRSQSFDFGSRQRDDEGDTQDVAPHPVVFSGPGGSEAQRLSPSPSGQASAMQRKGSIKSNKAVKTKPSISSTIALQDTFLPSVPVKTISTPSDNKLPIPQVVDQNSTSRSGLFRRIFGSSRNIASGLPPAPIPVARPAEDANKLGCGGSVGSTNVNKLHKQTHSDSIDISNKENIRPGLTKKPSSFFRRRKKSISTAIAPPVPLTFSTLAVSDFRSDEPSSFSSLKAFMDPYLTDDQEGTVTPTSPLRTARVLDQNSAVIDTTRTNSPETVHHQVTSSSRLVVPQRETFLTDSSSTEDAENSATSDLDTPEAPRTRVWPSPGTTPRAARAPSALSLMRPVVEARSSSRQLERLGVPLRKDSLPTLDAKQVMSSASSPVLKQAQMTTHRDTSGSDVSEYRSAPSTPAVQDSIDPTITQSPRLHISHPSISQGPNLPELDKAQQIYNNGEDDIDGETAAAWLGEAGSDRERIRRAYMHLFDWCHQSILTALRSLCSRLILRAESQLIDRILEAFSRRWCECNPTHGFKSADVVHTVCYSVLLLNTDLHMADIGSKMTRSQFVKNAMQTIRPVAIDADGTSSPTAHQLSASRSNSYVNTGPERTSIDRGSSRAASSLGHRPNEHLVRSESNELFRTVGSLIDAPFAGSQAGWEVQVETVLRDFYFSIQKEPLPLFGAESVPRFTPSGSNNNLLTLSGLRRTPSALSKVHSESNRSRYGDSKSLGSKWSKARSRPRLGSTPGFGSSKNSLDDQSSTWSPSISSTWSKASLGKTLASVSVDSFATSHGQMTNDYQSSIGFANALSQAIIREDQMETNTEDGGKVVPWLEDESLELEGAPWAKEGILKHKCHLEGVDKRAKDRNWNDCFAVIEKGWMRLFSFSLTAKSLRNKARTKDAGRVVGGGNWQDNAEEVWKFMLRHTIASSLPPPGYSKARPHVWALSLPTGAVHLFSVGTPDIVKEFVSTANFWSARLSKEPMIGGVSSMEYGWSDAVINRIFTGSDSRSSIVSTDMARPSTQMSVRSSIDHIGNVNRPRLPGDKVHISDWAPPQQSLLASQLRETEQLRTLQAYVQHVEEDLQRHNELRGPVMLAFSSKGSNYGKAMSNWEKKSSYLLREIVKFKTFIDALQAATSAKERILRMRREEDKQRQDDVDSMAIYQSTNMATETRGDD